MAISWKPGACCLGLGIVYTIIFMYALAYCTTCMALISIALIEVILLAGAAAAAYNGVNGNPYHLGTYWGIFGALIAVWIIFNACLCCCWKKVAVAIAVIDATADFMVATFRLSFLSALYSILFAIYLVLWFCASLSVISM